MYTNKFVEAGSRLIKPTFQTPHTFQVDINGVVRMNCVSKGLNQGGVSVNKQSFEWLTGDGFPATAMDKKEIRLANAISKRYWEGTIEMFPRFPAWTEGKWGTYVIIDEVTVEGWRDFPPTGAYLDRKPSEQAPAEGMATEVVSYFDGWSQVRLPSAQKLITENSKYYTMLTLVQENPNFALVITKDGLTAWWKT